MNSGGLPDMTVYLEVRLPAVKRLTACCPGFRAARKTVICQLLDGSLFRSHVIRRASTPRLLISLLDIIAAGIERRGSRSNWCYAFLVHVLSHPMLLELNAFLVQAITRAMVRNESFFVQDLRKSTQFSQSRRCK